MRLLQRMGGSEYVVARMQELQLGKLLCGVSTLTGIHVGVPYGGWLENGKHN
jgi:hypothetical protein